jgi:hypothetical protein
MLLQVGDLALEDLYLLIPVVTSAIIIWYLTEAVLVTLVKAGEIGLKEGVELLLLLKLLLQALTEPL